EQKQLHLRCAEVCAESVNLQEAVRHALRAGDVVRASELAIAAAAALSARHANGEAAALLEMVLEATDDPPTPIREQLAELYRVSGEYQRALGHARAVLEGSPDDPYA